MFCRAESLEKIEAAKWEAANRKMEFAVGKQQDGIPIYATQGNLYVQIDLPNNEILYSYVMSFSDSVEIIEPQSIREQMKKRLKKMQEKYRT